MATENVTVSFPSTPSQRIIAAGIVIGFCYWAQSVAMTLLLSVLLAYFLDPFVEWLERLRIPRGLGSLIVVLLAVAMLVMLGWTVVDRIDQFGADWPKYRAPLHAAAAEVERRLERFEARVSEIAPEEGEGKSIVQLAEPHPVRSALLQRLGSLYTVFLAATFVPFLVFFMLAAKRDVWHATMQLFPVNQRTRVKLALEEVSVTLRSFVVGNALVAGILGLASWLFFLAIGLQYSFLMGMASGALNLVPYLGVVLAWLPPLIVALPKWNTVGPFFAIFGVLTAFHLLALNVLIPALVGRKVHLSALAVTISLLFWGWLWGGLGLILAIPITATLKVVCDHVESWQPIGRWLGS
jgi:predicted PurR-regulated permease PerM